MSEETVHIAGMGRVEEVVALLKAQGAEKTIISAIGEEALNLGFSQASEIID